MKVNISGIYCLINSVNGKIYIGQSINIYKRFLNHKNSKNKNMPISNAIKKYGFGSFHKIVLEYVHVNMADSVNARHLLTSREQFWLDYFFAKYGPKYMYNICRIAYSVLGIKRSEEQEKK